MNSFVREKVIDCGYRYREIDIYPYTSMQLKRGKRSKKKNVCEPKQRNLNDKNARRYLNQLVHRNFSDKDLHVSVTYKSKYMPKTIEEANHEAVKYIRRIQYLREKANAPPLKYILITEGGKADDDGKIKRIHHHIIMNGGIDRDKIEELWRRRKRKGQKRGDKIGYANADRLQFEEGTVSGLCEYLAKDPNGRKRWTSSQNLIRPTEQTVDGKYRRREIEKLCLAPINIKYWERKYPGWTLTNEDYGIKKEYNEITGWAVYLRLKRKE